MRATITSPNAVSLAIAALNGLSDSDAVCAVGSTCHTLARAFGPCTAISAIAPAPSRRWVTVTALPVAALCAPIQAMSFSAVPALTTRRNQSSRKK